ncbi:hypothetical protein F7734_47525 [Scytonema sp. UIC 10036]|nr:hypothetical protein [Scytonema sp. UIC 10036]
MKAQIPDFFKDTARQWGVAPNGTAPKATLSSPAEDRECSKAGSTERDRL